MLEKILQALIETNKASLKDQHDIKKSLKILVANFTGRLNVITEAQASQAKRDDKEKEAASTGTKGPTVQEKEQKQPASGAVNPDIETPLDAERQLVADFEETNVLLRDLIKTTEVGFRKLQEALRPEPEKYSRAAARSPVRLGVASASAGGAVGGLLAERMETNFLEQRLAQESLQAARDQAKAIADAAASSKEGSGLPDVLGYGDGPDRRGPKDSKKPPQSGRKTRPLPKKPTFSKRPPTVPVPKKPMPLPLPRAAGPLAGIAGAAAGGIVGYELGGGTDVYYSNAEAEKNKEYIDKEVAEGKITPKEAADEKAKIEAKAEQKELVTQAGGVIGGTVGGAVGWKAGAAVGAAVGTAVLPVIGTAVGGAIGAVAGSLGGAYLGSKATSSIYDMASESSEKVGMERGVTIAGKVFAKGDTLTKEQLAEVFKATQYGQMPLKFVSDQFKKQMGKQPQDMKPEEFNAKLEKVEKKTKDVESIISSETAYIDRVVEQLLSDRKGKSLGGPSPENKQLLKQIVTKNLKAEFDRKEAVNSKQIQTSLSNVFFRTDALKEFEKSKSQEKTKIKQTDSYDVSEKTFAEKDSKSFKEYNDFKKQRMDEYVKGGMDKGEAEAAAKKEAIDRYRDKLNASGAISAPTKTEPKPKADIGSKTAGALGSSLGGSDMTNYLKATALIESSGNPNAKADTSSATGMFQFIDSTWQETVKKMGKDYTLEDRKDPAKAAEVMEYFTKQNKQQIEKATGKEASNTDLYMAHFLGAEGATKFLQAKEANPNQSAAALNPKGAAANKTIYFDENGRARSVQEVYDLMGKKVSNAERAVQTGKWGKKDIPEAVASLKAKDDLGKPLPVAETTPTQAIKPMPMPVLASKPMETQHISAMTPPPVKMASIAPMPSRSTGDYIYNTNNQINAARDESSTGGSPIITNVVNNNSSGGGGAVIGGAPILPRMESPLNRYQDKTSAFMGIG